MATAQSIIYRAFRILGVMDAHDAPQAQMTEDAFDVLNNFMAELHEADIRLPDYSFAALATSLASDNADAEALAYQLAKRLAPEYGVSLSPEAQEAAVVTFARLRSRYFQARNPLPSEFY